MRNLRHRQRGVSLIEALVAFAVMALGMMAVAGMQSTLRTSGDLARQRAEAVRIAQDSVESWRAFTTLNITAQRTAFADVATAPAAFANGGNATYTVTRRASAPAAVSGATTPVIRTLVVDVTWEDRTGQSQSVRLGSTLTGLEPDLAGSLVLAAGPEPVIAPRARHRGIPQHAVQLLGVGTSGFVPPGQSGSGNRVAWVFNNADGLITICDTTATISGGLFGSGAPTCGTQKARLLSGVVRFATGVNPASSVTSLANPTGTAVNFGLQVLSFASPTIEDETGATLVTCFIGDFADNQQPYFCAVPIANTNPRWGGRVDFTSPLNIASTASVTATNQFRVCRYHEAARYLDVGTSLLNQNFVVIQAGDGSSTAYVCPSTAQPPVWLHQPRTTS